MLEIWQLSMPTIAVNNTNSSYKFCLYIFSLSLFLQNLPFLSLVVPFFATIQQFSYFFFQFSLYFIKCSHLQQFFLEIKILKILNISKIGMYLSCMLVYVYEYKIAIVETISHCYTTWGFQFFFNFLFSFLFCQKSPFYFAISKILLHL